MERNTRVRLIVEDLFNGCTRRGANLEKLRGSSFCGNPIYSVRTSDKARLIFTRYRYEGQSGILLLEFLPNHYKKSKFLKPGVYQGLSINEVDSKIESLWQAVSKKEKAEVLPAGKVSDRFVALDYYKSAFIELSNSQGEALVARTPAVVSGPPGSGKSCVALQSISRFLSYPENQQEKRVLFVCLSKELAETEERFWKQQPLAEEGSTEVCFLSYAELLKTLSKELGEAVTREEALGWLKEKQAIDPQSTYEELQVVASCGSFEEYRDLGSRQSLFTSSELRRRVWDLFGAYNSWLASCGKHDIRWEAEREAGIFDLIVVDEAADLSPEALMYLYELARDGNISYFMDTQQDIESCLSKRIHLKRLMDDKGVTLSTIDLPAVYRCPKKIVDFANRWLGIKAAVLGGISDKREYRKVEVAEQEGKTEGEISWNPDFQAACDHLQKSYARADIAVICAEERKSDEVLKDIKSFMLFTPREVKGLEFPAVILYRPFDAELFTEVNQLLAEVDEAKLSKHQHRAKGVDQRSIAHLAPELSKVFVSITRAEKTLVVCQKKEHKHRHIERLCDLQMVAETENSIAASSDGAELVQDEREALLNRAKSFLDAGDRSRFEQACQELGLHPENVMLGLKAKSTEERTTPLAPVSQTRNRRRPKGKGRSKKQVTQTSRSQQQRQPAKMSREPARKSNKRTRKGQAQLIQGLDSFEHGLKSLSEMFKMFSKTLGERSLSETHFQRKNALAHAVSNPLDSGFLAAITPEGARDKLLPRGNDTDSQGYSPKDESFPQWVSAVRSGNKQALEDYLSKGVHVDEIDPVTGFTPLMWAAYDGHVEIVEWLLVRGADVDSKPPSKAGPRPLDLAVAKGHRVVVQKLLEGGAVVSANSEDTAIKAAAEAEHREILALLVAALQKQTTAVASASRS